MNTSRDFFNLPLHEKEQIHVNKGGIAWRGYMPLGGEETHGHVDHKEGLYLGRDHDDQHPRVLANTPLFGMNQLPPDSVLPQARSVIDSYVQQVTELGDLLTRIISCSLGLDPEYMQNHFILNDPLSIFRLWKYPAVTASSSCGIGEHSDYGLLSLLHTTGDGLQFRLPVFSDDDEEAFDWIDVPPMDGAFIVNVGDLLDRMSYGIFPSRRHRVVNQCADQDRYTAVLFYDPSWDCPMDHLPVFEQYKYMTTQQTIERNNRWHESAYKELRGHYSDFLAQKVKRVFPELLKDYQCEYARSESTRFQIHVENIGQEESKKN